MRAFGDVGSGHHPDDPGSLSRQSAGKTDGRGTEPPACVTRIKPCRHSQGVGTFGLQSDESDRLSAEDHLV